MPCETRSLTVSKAGFQTYTLASYTPTCSASNTKDVGLVANTTAFGGKVTNTVGGAAIAGAAVAWGATSTVTDASGNYSFANLPCETRSLTVSKAGFQTYTQASYAPNCSASSQKNMGLIPANALKSVAIDGPSIISQNSSTSYTCTAQFIDLSTADVSKYPECEWGIIGSAPVGTIIFGNIFMAGDVEESTPISIKAKYSSGGETRSATKTVVIQPRFGASIQMSSAIFNQQTFLWDLILYANTQGPNGTATSFAWDLDGDSIENDSTIQSPSINLAIDETRLVSLTAKDTANNTATAQLKILKGKPAITNEIPLEDTPVSNWPFTTLNASGAPFVFDAAKKTNGLIVIVHGLTDSALSGWATNMAQSVLAELGTDSPNIMLFDWSTVADPETFIGIGIPGWKYDPFDLFAIRLLGPIMGLQLANWMDAHIKSGDIDLNAPIHIVGHSAGGFVAGSCACVLGADVKQVTMLDTPLPYPAVRDIYLAGGGLVEQYKTAYGFGAELWATQYPEQMYWTTDYWPPYLFHPLFNEGHNWAYVWYTETIKGAINNGFYYSPFMGNGFHGNNPMSLKSPLATKPLDATISTVPIADFSAFGNVTNAGEVYTVTESSNAGISKTVAFSIGVQSLRFRYQFVSPGDGDYLAVYWGTNSAVFIGLDLPISRDSAVPCAVDFSDFAGLNNTLVFKLISRSNANAVIVIDGIELEVSEDADNDALSNDEEETLGTDPLKPDSDGDGVTDGDEVNIFGTNPLNSDSDGDGVGDGDEIKSGTSPRNIDDFLGVTEFRAVGVQQTEINWMSVSGKKYRVNRGLSLLEDNFSTLTNSVSATAPTNTFTDSTASNRSLFYWIQLDE